LIWTPIENRSEEQKRMLWLGTQAERQRYIYWAKVKIGKALRTQAKLAADAIEKAVAPDVASQAVGEAIDKSKPVITAVYHRLYMMIAPVFASKVLASIKATPAQESQWHRLVNEYLTSPETESKIVGINDVTKRRIMTVIDENQGKSLIEIANAIRTNVMLDQISMGRAMVIAHTETVTASNWGSLMGAKTSGANVKKQWISTRDNATRGLKPTDEFDHFHMDSKGAELDGVFDVPMRPSGVEQLQFPGDPTGSAGNIINCRCTIGYLRKG